MIVLSLNSGSSSLKFLVYDWDKQLTLATGIAERITVGGSFIQYSAQSKEPQKIMVNCTDHKSAVQEILNTLTSKEYGVLTDIHQIQAVGHRVVHGGEKFTKSVIITPEVIKEFKNLYDLAPLHNPPNVLGIEAAQAVLPEVQHMAIMDTAWHQTMPKHSYMYALPYSWYQNNAIRRYGFHGTSFLYTAKRAAVLLGKDPFKTNLVIAHIGNGASANAIKNGCSYDTSMGLTPLEGLIMGTRSGDFDAAIGFCMMDRYGKTPSEIKSILNKECGVLGITGKYTDRRDVEIAAKEGDERCQLAIEMESYRLRKYIGSYIAAIGGTDAIVFTAGVGEMSPLIRAKALEGLECMGVKIDLEKNDLAKTRNAETEISTADSKVKVFVIPTDEERVFVEDVIALLNGTYKDHTEFVYQFQKADYINQQRKADFALECQKKPERKLIEKLPPKK